MNVLRYELREERIFMHLGDKVWKEGSRQIDELYARTSQSAIGIRALRALQAPFTSLARSALVSLKHAVPARYDLPHIMC